MHKRTKRKDYIRNKNKTKGKSRVKNNILNKLNSDKNLRFNERIPRRLLRDAPVPHSSSVYAHAQPQDSANLRPIGISNLSKVLSLILIVFIGLGLFYYFGSFGITGLVIYSDSTITLDVNSLVSKDAQIFVNVGAEEQIKPITGFDLPLMNESYYVSSLNVDIISLNFSLDPGTYSFVVSLIDNSTLIAITSKDITISLEQPVIERPQEPVQEQVNETNLTLPEIINETNTTVPEPLPEPVVSNISDLSKVEQEVLDEINSKGSARVIVKKTFNLVTTADLINELEQNITIDELRFVKRGELASDIKKEFENNSFDLNDYARLEEEFSETDTSKRVLSVVQLTDGANKLAELINKSEIITVEQEVDDIVALNVDVNMLNKMINLSSVNQIILDNEVNLFVQDAINITKVNVVQQLGYSGNGKSVCILDTGINYNLFGLILNQTIHGYDFVNQDDDPLDDHGHGTSVGNILLNVAPNSNVYAVKVINSNGVGYESDILAGLQYCINNNVDVISFSIGSRLSNGYCDSNIVANKSNYAVEQGIHIIAATGNDGSNTEIRVPACASNVLRVASSNKQDNVSSFSNVYLNDLLAPGQDINTVDLSGNSTALSGSSLSAPLVSGAALLILENQSYNPGNLTHLFRSTSDVIFNDGIRDYERLNLYNALINNITHVPFDYDANQANVTSGEFFGFANPSFNTPTLNSTDVRTNNTNVNISLSIVSTDATGLYNITTWYENNQSLLVLNMPFVTNTTDVKDYSGYNNNGTISGALWQRYLNEDNNSLVLLLPFDEDNSTTAIDASDYRNDGVLSGVALNTNNCVTGTCYTFNGVNSNITTNNLNLGGANEFTVETWIYPLSAQETAVNYRNTIYSGHVFATPSWWLEVFGNDIVIQNLTTPFPTVSTTGDIIQNNQWYLVSLTKTGSAVNSNLTIYVNGALKISGLMNTTPTTRSFIGSLGGTAGDKDIFNGTMDNFRIYNKALTSSEIQDHYEKYKLYYQPSFKFDGKQGINFTRGQLGTAINSSSAITMEAWVNQKSFPSPTGAQVVLAGTIGNSGGGFGITILGAGTVSVGGRSIASDAIQQTSSLSNISLNNWTHIVGEMEFANDLIKIYINGKLDKTFTASFSRDQYNHSILSTATKDTIGFFDGQNRYFNGSIQGVRIYNRSLSANQIYELYNSYNTSGINTLVSEETTAGRTYKAQVYVANSSDLGVSDNTSEVLILDNYLTFTNNPVINSTNAQNTTEQDLNVYFTPDNTGITLNYSIEVFKNNATQFLLADIPATANTFAQFIINNANTTKGETWKAQVWLTDSLSNSSLVNTSELLILNYIPNITFNLINTTDISTNNTNVNLTLFINNTDYDNDIVANITNWYENNQSILVLNMPFVTNTTDVKDYSGYNNNGTISGALWQRYLNEDNNSLVLLLPFDEDNSTTAIDASDYRNDGVLINAKLNTSCITGTCYSFDGSGDYININDSNDNLDISLNNSFTIEYWMKYDKSDATVRDIISKWSSSVSKKQYRIYHQNNILAMILSKDGTTNSNTLTSSASLTANQWYYVTWFFNGTSVALYINGNLDKQQAFSNGAVFNADIPLRIGASADAQAYQGIIDNVRIYNKALTSSEIQDHYEKYKLYYQPSFKFDGVNNLINITTSSRSLGLSQELWVRNITNSTWVHLINNSGDLFVNGINASDNLYPIPISNKTNSIRIGIYDNEVYFNGSILSVRLWNRSLSANQIFELYNSYNTSALNKLVSEETTAGRTYKASLYASDTYADSSQVNTSEILITASAPNNFTLYLPGNNTKFKNSSNEVNISWVSSSDIDAGTLTYYAQVARDASFADTIYQGITTSTFNTTNALTNGTYYARINSTDGSLWSGYSNIISFIINTVPFSYNIQLSSSNGTNLTLENLTLSYNLQDTDLGEDLFNITNWYENNQSLLVLNMPFVTNTTDVKDYSGYNNNGTISGALWQRYLNEDNNSLVLLMPFDEDNSSTAIDSSDFKNNGVLSGATLNRTDCITGNCYSFDGTNDFINLIDKSSLDFGASDFSIELWIKHPVSAITNGRIVYKGASSATDVGYALLGDAQNIFALSNGSTRLLVTAGKTNFNNDLWNHIAITVKRDNNITIYTNGIIDSSSSNPLNVSNFSGSVSNTKEFILGSIDGTGTFWNGSIDNVRIYNKALTSSEIQDHYEKYKLYYQPSFKFDGVNDMINITKDINDDFGKTGFTMESWIWNNINDQPQMSSSGVNILSDVGSGISDRYELRINNISSSPVIYYRIQDSNAINEEVSNAGNLNNNSWNHIIVTYDNVNAQIRAYANGVLTNTNPTAFTGTISPNDNLYIGIAGLVRDYKGSITGVRIYNRSLSANQIYELYNSYNTSALNKLVSEETTKGNTYKASVWVSDTRDEDVQRNSTELLIGNTIPTIPVLSYPPNNTYFKDDTPEFFINNSDDPDNDTIYFVLEIDNAFDFTSINYYNGTIRKISNGTNSHNLSSALTDGIYYWRTLATDLQGNSSYTEIRNFTIDTINSTIDFTSPTEANNTYTNNSYIFINVTVTEANFANITFYLVNSTSVNATLFTSLNNNARWINLSPLNQNEVYYYNVSVADLANNINYSETRIITLDNTLPNNITLLSPGNNTISTNRTPLFTWNNVTELNFDNYTLEIDNDADFTSVQFTFIKYNNLTNSTHLMTTPLNDNTRYFWKITVTDKANNRNSTTFTYTTDNTKPAVTLNSPGNNQWLTASTVNFQYIPTDTPFNSNLQACDLYGNFTSTTFEKNNTQTPAGGAINTFTLILADSSYTWNVQCNDSAGNSARAAANFTVNLDTVRPSLSYSGQTEVNNSYKNQNFIFVNWTYTEANFANLTFRLFNTTGNVNTTVYTSTAYQINVSNYTIYLINPNERYTYNITLTDYALQMNTTETRTIILDTINPSLSYSEQTLANNTYYNSNTLFVNWTYSDTNFANFTFTLANLTGVVNQTIYNTTAYQINLTLPNTNYSYNLTIRDLANNYNETSTRVVVLDNAIPVPIYDSRTEANNTYVQRNWAFINITLTETNLANITYVISNSSFTNITVFGSRTLDINFTNLADGNYTYNVTIRDLANNVNSTETRTIVIDTVLPVPIYDNTLTLVNNSYFNKNWAFINITLTETNLANITYVISNSSFTNITVFGSRTLDINFTNLADGNYTYNVTIRDLANNVNSTETRLISIDAAVPLIEFGNSTEANNTQLRQNWTFINITFTETNVANITFRLFNQTSLVNETVSPSTNIIRAINFTNLPNINNIRYTYNVTIVDFSNNENVTETRTIILDNVLPSIPTLGNPRNDTWQLYDNSTSFGWQDSTDLENSTLNYEFQLSNNTVFNNTYFIKNINITQSNYTLTVNEMPSVGRHYWRVRAYDGTNYSSYSSLFQVDIVYAVINITSPNYNSIVRILNTYEFKVEEIANTNWTQRVNITFTAAGTSYGPFLMTNNSDPLTNYTYNFTIPNVNPGFLTVVATGYNETLSINATSRFRITIPETPAVTRPGITDAYSINTYTYPNVSANITVRSDLSVLLNTITVQIFQPNGTTSTLTSTVNNEDNADDEDFNYEHNYTFTPGDLGEHIIAVSITDTNYPDSAYIAYKNNSFYVNTSRGISLIASGAGLNNITLKDIYSRHTLNKLNNSENVTIIPGNYDIKVSTSKIEAELINGTIYENPITLCSFEDIEDTVDPPSNVRSVDQFTLDCGNSTYNSVNLTYNYTNIIGSVTFEENLNIYKCDSTSSCSWVRQNKSLDTTNNLIIARFSNFSVFMLSEDTSTTTTTVATSGGAGGGSGGGLSRLIAIDIIQPGNLTIYEEDTIITPIKIKNTGKTSLFGIFLVASTLNEGLELSLDNNFISALIPGQEDATNLRIVSRNFTGENAEVLVTAKVTTPVVQDQVKFLLNVLTGGKTKAEEQITFAEEFFNGNPECLELKELLDQAQIALDNREYDEAVKIVDSAIQSCKNLLSLEGKQPRLPTEAELSDLLILGLETLVFFILTYSMYNYYKKRRLRNLNK